MKKIRLRGMIYQIDIKLLSLLLVNFFGPKLVFKTRIHGEEFKFEDENISFFCSSALDGKGKKGKYNYIVEGEYFRRECEFKVFLDDFLKIFLEKEIIYELEYQSEDENDIPIADEVLLTHPKYIDFIQNYHS